MKIIRLISVGLFVFGLCSGQQASSLLPVDKNATSETKNLLINLKKQVSKGIMFGHQDDLLYGRGWKYEHGLSDVRRICGDYPAVYGWEIGKVEVGSDYNLDSVPFSEIREHIREAYARGGVNTVSWHANNPATDGRAWDTTRVVHAILPGGKHHELFKQRLDKLAAFLLDLKDDQGKPIPILFRPYHENTGVWFWWGAGHCTPQEYVELYQFTVKYLTQVKGVHNLLFVFSPDRVKNKEQYFERYPGDEFVDVLGLDVYCWNGPNASQEYRNIAGTDLSIITDAAKERNKLATFSETGLEQIPNSKWWTEVLWKTIENYPISYVLVWRDAYNMPNHYYVPYPGHAAADDFVEFYKLPRTLFQGDIANANLYK